MLCNSVGGFINNRPPDLDTYLQVVRIPDDKFKDKAVKDMREYVVTAEEIRGKALPYEEFRDALVSATEAAGLELRDEPLTEDENRGVQKIASRIARANRARDPWTIELPDAVGRERFTVPFAGYAMWYIRTREVRTLLIGLVALSTLVSLLRHIWRREPLYRFQQLSPVSAGRLRWRRMTFVKESPCRRFKEKSIEPRPVLW